MTQRTHKLDISSPTLSFSSGHFTIFSATHRENLHGHDYQLAVTLTTTVGEDGISFDYRDVKKALKKTCDTLNSRTILPANNPYLKITTDNNQLFAHYDNEVISFLVRDAIVLPIRNTTLEELSYWFLEQFLQDCKDFINHSGIHGIDMHLSTRPGQTGTSSWSRRGQVVG